ncbi:MAG: YitT family protein, partial [Acutalibacteraceae bacterium]|nr:YitT family protein [Acutalibacteraceae bacterium]
KWNEKKGIQVLCDILVCIIGSALVGTALSVFTIPNEIAPGGISGLSTALAYVLGVRVSVLSLVLNIPIMLAAYRLLGKRSFFYTLLSTALLSGFIELASFLPVYTGNILIAAVYGGVLSGIGIGILFLRNITTGGTDLIALMLHKAFPNVPNGTILAVIDGIVVLIAVLVFRKIEVALTSVLTIYFSSKVIDLIAQGVDYAKVIYIVTDKGKELSAVLNSSTDRGNTVIKAFGGYTGAEKQLVITVTRRNVLAQTLRLIHATDPAAFTFVTDSTEVHGEGFKIDYN